MIKLFVIRRLTEKVFFMTSTRLVTSLNALSEQKKQALSWHKQGQLVQAQQAYQTILHQHPQELSVWHLLGILYQQQGNLDEALACCQQVLAVQPESVAVLSLAGVIAGQLERHAEAISYFDQAIMLQKHDVASHYNRAVACNKCQHYQEALLSLNVVIQQQKNHAEAFNLRGTVLSNLKHYDDALANYQHALAVKADYPVALYHCGVVLEKLKRYDEAVTFYQQALTQQPNYSKALSNLANLFMVLQCYPLAIEIFKQLLTVEPNYPYAAGKLLYAQTHACDWRDYQNSVNHILSAVRQQQKVISPFEFLNVLSTAEDEKTCTQVYVNDRHPVEKNPLWQGERYRHQKIKIAYISADFYNHATSILMIELFEQHDKSRFEIIAIAFNSQNDDMTNRVKLAVDVYIDVSEKSDLEIAQLIKDMEIDIAVDLKGHTADARLGIFAHRPAPIQVNYLGQASTIGATYIDYILVDKQLVPPEYQQHYVEKVVYLPVTYLVTDSKRPIAAQTSTRQEHGLPESGFVFCCFNNKYKISPFMFDSWMRLLHQVPNSVLWLIEANKTASHNLRQEAQLRGIAPERLVFAPKVASALHLARHRHADLFLDTLPVNAHTTASDALWAGLPVLTCMGQTFASRVAGSLLVAVGLPELITHNLADYEAMALQLANSPELLAGLKQKLNLQRDSCPLFDIDHHRQAFESAYITMWQRYQEGLPPEGFSVSKD